jgi:hypothetical protein
MQDSLIKSLVRGRVLAAATSAAAGTSVVAVATGWADDAALMLTAVLNAVSVLAAIASKVREIWRGGN